MPNKLYIRGLDEVDAKSVEEYLEAHTGERDWKHIEWIDDSSANIVWNREASIGDIIRLFAQDENEPLPSTDLRPAKPHPTRADVQLYIRQSLVGDRKIRGAKDRSRFYLIHPEHDPDNRPRERRGRDRRSSPRRERPTQSFSADMYDDDDDENDTSAQMPLLSHEERDRHRQTFKDLFESRKKHGRLSSRSRSPDRDRDGDGRFGFPEDGQPVRQTARYRSRSPLRSRRRSPESDRAGDDTRRKPINAGKELFPVTASLEGRLQRGTSNENRSTSRDSKPNSAKELFPSAARGSSASSSTRGGSGFSIKGRGAAMDDFSIIGASAPRKVNKRVKELFPEHASKPDKSRNAGKELFGTSSGDGGRRRRAEDLL